MPFGLGLGSVLKNIAQLSSEDMGNFASSPSPTVPLNSIARDKPSEDRHEKANFVTRALSVFESI